MIGTKTDLKIDTFAFFGSSRFVARATILTQICVSFTNLFQSSCKRHAEQCLH